MKRNNKVKFFKSINFKIALTFTLMLLVTLEIVGVFFVKHLEQQNINSFKQQVQLPAYVDNSLSEQLNRSNTKKANKEIKSILTNVNNPDITEIRVVDNNGIIRGTSDSANNNLVGQKTTNLNIKNAIYNGRTYKHNENNLKSNDRYYVSIVPLLNNSNGGHNIVGALYVRASLTNVYKNIRSITIIYFFAALIAIILGLFMSYIIARAITKPIYDMRKQTIQISRGNYKGKVRVYDSDELGQFRTQTPEMKSIDNNVRDVLKSLVLKLLRIPVWKLVDLTHKDPSWCNYKDEIMEYQASDYRNEEIESCFVNNEAELK